MAYENLSESLLDYFPCRYGKSKLLFRGPKRKLDQEYVAYLGGTKTYGKFIETPYSDIVEELTGVMSVNLGCVNAGIDVYAHDQAVLDVCHNAELTVVQVLGAQNMSNRFYSVHPRRNDRFVRASTLLQTIYREVDFTEYNFTRHLLTGLKTLSPDRFEIVRRELKDAWVARMKNLLGQIDGKKLLVWLSEYAPEDENEDIEHQGDAPLFVDREMLKTMQPGAVLVDVAIDQGGCFETSKATTHAEPTYIVEGIVHYCVANMPGGVARTSTMALNNATLPFAIALANKGLKQALLDDAHLMNGLNVHKGMVTYQAVSEALGHEYVSAEQALAS